MLTLAGLYYPTILYALEFEDIVAEALKYLLDIEKEYFSTFNKGEDSKLPPYDRLSLFYKFLESDLKHDYKLIQNVYIEKLDDIIGIKDDFSSIFSPKKLLKKSNEVKEHGDAMQTLCRYLVFYDMLIKLVYEHASRCEA